MSQSNYISTVNLMDFYAICYIIKRENSRDRTDTKLDLIIKKFLSRNGHITELIK